MSADDVRRVGVLAAAVAISQARRVRRPSARDFAIAAIALEAGLSAIDEAERIASMPCDAEMWSWDYFRHGQVDPYWIRCTIPGPHDEHEDGNTGAHWKDEGQ